MCSHIQDSFFGEMVDVMKQEREASLANEVCYGGEALSIAAVLNAGSLCREYQMPIALHTDSGPTFVLSCIDHLFGASDVVKLSFRVIVDE